MLLSEVKFQINNMLLEQIDLEARPYIIEIIKSKNEVELGRLISKISGDLHSKNKNEVGMQINNLWRRLNSD